MLGLHERVTFFWRAVARRMTLPVYLSSLLLGTLGLVAWLLLLHGAGVTGGPVADTGLTLLGAALMLFPASEAVVALVNRLISESARPQHLPRLALANGIPAEHRVLVVIPAMLTSARQQIRALNVRDPGTTEVSAAAPRFILLHRERLFSATEQRWIGWE